jgi:hypothetical protein
VKYDGTTNPQDFLQVCTTAMVATGANDWIMANWFPLALTPSARSWLMNLPKGSVESWADLCYQFVSVFQGGFKCPGTMADLQAIVQKPGEMLRSFMQ